MSVFRVGVFEVDLRAGELRRQGRVTRLQDKPLQLLALLIEHPNSLVTREQIVERLWGGDSYHNLTDSLNQSVRKLRRGFREKASNPQIIQTIRGRGYRLSAQVEPVGSGTQQAGLASGVSAELGPYSLLLHPAIRNGLSTRCVTGREAELQSLKMKLELARRNHRQLVFISGEAGIGKTTLAFSFARSAAVEASVLLGTCERSALTSFKPFVEVLEWINESLPAEMFRDLLSGVEGSHELACLAPTITTRTSAGDGELTAHGRRYRMFDAFIRLLKRLAEHRPVLLVLEDLHLADTGSMLLLRQLVRSTQESALCIIVTSRDAELQQDPLCRELWLSLRREPSAEEITLSGLGEEDIGVLYASYGGTVADPALVRLLTNTTGGNPFYVTELLRHVSKRKASGQTRVELESAVRFDFGIPATLSELVALQLARLGTDCEQILTLAAVAGREFKLPIVQALAELPEEQFFRCMDSALAARLVKAQPGSGGSFSFTHEIVREIIYERQPVTRRLLLHHQLAEVLEEYRGVCKVSIAELAHHFCRASSYADADKAVAYAVRAAEEAASGLALEEASRYYGMALDATEHLPDSVTLQERRLQLFSSRGRLLAQTGQWAAAKEVLIKALELASALPDKEAQRCELWIRLAESSFWLMDVADVQQFAGAARRAAEQLQNDDLSADADAWKATALAAEGNVPGAIQMDRKTLASGRGLRSFAGARIPLTLYWAGLTSDAVDSGSRVVRYARESPKDPDFLLYSLQHAALALSGAGRYSQAVRLFEEARSVGTRCGALPLLARATCMSVAPYLSLGDLDEARVRAIQARDLALRIGFDPPFVSAGIDLLLISARSGTADQTSELLTEVTRSVEKAAGWHAWKWRMRLSQARAELALASGEWKEAAHFAASVIDQSRACGRLKYEALGQAALSHALAQLGCCDAIDKARAAVLIATRLDDPAVLLECLAALLDIAPDQDILSKAQWTIRRTSTGILEEELRAAFLASCSAKFPAGIWRIQP